MAVPHSPVNDIPPGRNSQKRSFDENINRDQSPVDGRIIRVSHSNDHPCRGRRRRDRTHPTAFVKDSAITTKIEAKVAAEHFSSLAHIHVDTDANGIVWLSGSAGSQAEIDKAVAIA